MSTHALFSCCVLTRSPWQVRANAVNVSLFRSLLGVGQCAHRTCLVRSAEVLCAFKTTEKVLSKHGPLTRCAARKASERGIKIKIHKGSALCAHSRSLTCMARTSPILGMNP